MIKETTILFCLLLQLAILLIQVPLASAQKVPELSHRLVGSEFAYKVNAGDSMTSIGGRFGAGVSALARTNGLDTRARLKPGQMLRIDNRHIVPESADAGILINLPQRLLFYFVKGELVSHYPVALGRPDWPTPIGRFKVITIEENPVWDVPKSIQEEMRREGKVVKTKVPPCPENPLGKYWIGLSMAGYGIHGTIVPMSIYQFRTHGCIRLHPDDIGELAKRLSVGASGEIIYEPVLLAQIEGKRIFLEAHRDVYKKRKDLPKTVQALASAQGLVQLIDWPRAEEAMRRKEGVAREVTKKLASDREDVR